MVSTLRAITAIFRATAGLNAQEFAKLDLVFRPVGAIDFPTFLNKFEEWKVINGVEVLERAWHNQVDKMPTGGSACQTVNKERSELSKKRSGSGRQAYRVATPAE
jgi:hypothetical protein